MGKRRYAYIKKNGSQLEVFDKEGNMSELWKARFDMDISDEEIQNREFFRRKRLKKLDIYYIIMYTYYRSLIWGRNGFDEERRK